MVLLNKIYTRGGDKGQTSLTNGERTLKDSLRVSCYGTVDELNSSVGIARLHTRKMDILDKMLARIQNDLFDLGCDISMPFGTKHEKTALRIIAPMIQRLENEIDLLNEDLEPLNSFVLPGGSPASAYLHLSRTICRRAERLAISASKTEEINPEAIKYLNRLSDLFFVMSRSSNDKGASDVLWVPGLNYDKE